MTSTRIRLLVGIAVVVGVVTWAVLRVLDAWRGGFPALGWATPATLALCAAALFGTLLAVRPRLLRRQGTKPVPPLQAARFAVLALACSRAGAAFVGAYLGFALALSGEWDTSYGKQRAIYAVLAALASLALVVAALLLERACRLPDDDLGPDGGLGSAA